MKIKRLGPIGPDVKITFGRHAQCKMLERWSPPTMEDGEDPSNLNGLEVERLFNIAWNDGLLPVRELCEALRHPFMTDKPSPKPGDKARFLRFVRIDYDGARFYGKIVCTLRDHEADDHIEVITCHPPTTTPPRY